jgi:hypothetical protein
MFYRVALLHLEASRSTPGGATADKLHLIKQAMEVIGRRWQVARTSSQEMTTGCPLTYTESYLSLLSRHEIMQAMR